MHFEQPIAFVIRSFFQNNMEIAAVKVAASLWILATLSTASVLPPAPEATALNQLSEAEEEKVRELLTLESHE